MALVVRGVLWVGLYFLLAAAPLVFALLGDAPPGRGFLVDFSVALGFVGLSMMGVQFVLVARFRAVAAPFGQDAVIQFHRQISYVATGFILAHPILLAIDNLDVLALFNPVTAPWRARFALLAMLCLLAVVVSSTWRRRLRLRYEVWQVAHSLLSAAAVLLALLHVALVGYYVDTLAKRVLWVAMTAVFVAMMVWIRLVKPLLRVRRPWLVESVTPERGDAHTVTLRPDGHPGMRFAPGQFGWLMVDRSAFAFTGHPFSFSSSAEDSGRIQMTIKALGDFTRSVPSLEPGTRAYLDGPYGVFTPDRNEGPGFVLIAGGIGSTPLISILRTLADREDRRPCLLFYAVEKLSDATFADDLERLRERLHLTVVPVVADPPDDWTGERGFVDVDLLRRHLPRRHERMQYFVCGPPPMLAAMEQALAEVGVAPERVHAERFDFV